MSNRAITILIGCVLVIVLGTLGVRAYLKKDEAPVQATTAPVKKDKQRTAVRVVVTQCVRHYGKTEATGYIENVGNVDLHHVTVNSIWKNSAGLVIRNQVVYALKDGKLAPGERKEYQDVTDLVTATKCNAEPIDWW